jgi:hypothetical protein
VCDSDLYSVDFCVNTVHALMPKRLALAIAFSLAFPAFTPYVIILHNNVTNNSYTLMMTPCDSVTCTHLHVHYKGKNISSILTSPSVDGATLEYLDSQTTSVNVLGLCIDTFLKDSPQL